jgi:hypothetical protein
VRMTLQSIKARWFIGVLLAVLCSALLLAFGLRGMIRNGVNRANYERIQVGMARAEVEAIMGGPGGDLPWLGQEDIAVDERLPLLLHNSPEKVECWQSGNHQIIVWYNARGESVSKYYTRHEDTGLLQRFLDCVHI